MHVNLFVSEYVSRFAKQMYKFVTLKCQYYLTLLTGYIINTRRTS